MAALQRGPRGMRRCCPLAPEAAAPPAGGAAASGVERELRSKTEHVCMSAERWLRAWRGRREPTALLHGALQHAAVMPHAGDNMVICPWPQAVYPNQALQMFVSLQPNVDALLGPNLTRCEVPWPGMPAGQQVAQASSNGGELGSVHGSSNEPAARAAAKAVAGLPAPPAVPAVGGTRLIHMQTAAGVCPTC
jgi:hypothetical protein